MLIVRCLSDSELLELSELAYSIGLEALIEVHNEDEVKRAIKIKPELIGINNRNLDDFSVKLETSAILKKSIPEDCLVVAESGIKTNNDIQYLLKQGIKSFLIGRRLKGEGNQGRAFIAQIDEDEGLFILDMIPKN